MKIADYIFTINKNKKIMRQRIAVFGFLLILLILIAGCTSSQGGTSTVSKAQNTGPGSLSAKEASSGSSSQQSTTFECALAECINEDQLIAFFPDIVGWQRSPPSANGCRISVTYYNNENYNKVFVTIEDYSPCNYDANDYYQKFFKLGEWVIDSNHTMIRTLVTYHGYPTVRSDIKNSGNVWPDQMMIIVNPKLSVSISVNILDAKSPSELDSEYEKFANAIDLNGLAQVADTLPSITSTPIKSWIVLVSAKYNPQDGIITVTNNGGSSVEDLSYITVSVNGSNLPTKLNAKVGSIVTAQGNMGSKNHVIAIGTFKDGSQQIVLDIVV